MAAAEPEKGMGPSTEADVRARLRAIAGPGIETSEEDGDISVAWSAKVAILAWLGPHHVEGGATEEGYTFHWSDLRDPVIAAVTGAGWTYKPKTI